MVFLFQIFTAICVANALELSSPVLSRRHAFVASAAGFSSVANVFSSPALAEDTNGYDFERRDRKNNQGAVIREDYWYMMGKTPPRVLTTQLKGDDPQWNAFGSCTQSDGGNSCTYVSLSLRIPAYSKYGSSIAYGASEFSKLGQVLDQINQQPSNNALWQQAATYVELPQDRQMPPGIVDAELKMVLFATAMTTSPNFPQPGKELLVARFYANECRHANRELLSAIQQRDLSKTMEAWKFGRDSWNSYFQVVNRSISPKVGEKFELLARVRNEGEERLEGDSLASRRCYCLSRHKASENGNPVLVSVLRPAN